MGDPSGETEFEEDPPEVNCSKVRWIMNMGFGIGKKILLTGIVISSAPLVLPPLVVISAIGLACCVPCGIVMASYTCSEKLMSKLLPYSTPPLSENGTLMSNNEEAEQEQGTWVGGKVDTQKEEGGGRQGIVEGADKRRIELLKKEDDGIIEEWNVEEWGEYGQEGVKKNAQEYAAEDVGEIVEENLYEEDVGNSFDVEEEPMMGYNIDGVEFEGLSEDYKGDTPLDKHPVSEVYGTVLNVIEGDDETGKTPIEVTTVVMEESEGQERVSDIVEEEELATETRGLLEKMRAEGNADNAIKMDEQYLGEIESGKEVRDQKIGGNVEEMDAKVEYKVAEVRLKKPTNTMGGVVAEGTKECEDMQESQEMRYANNANTVSDDVKPTGGRERVLESKNADNRLEAEKPVRKRKKVNNILEAEMRKEETRSLRPVVSGIVEDKQKPVINKEEILQGGRAVDNIDDLYFKLIRDKEIVIASNADAREIADESGLNLFDEKNVSGQEYRRASYETFEEPSGHVGDEGTDFAELPVSRRAQESTDARISSEKAFMHSNGVLSAESKIWAQIDAMKSIVGYKGTPHATCIEELKALYIFTGVEPPASFNDHPDLAQVNDKLHFLMSIVGVKVDS